jgi:N-acetylmuramoyl-L-alanine amidase
MRKIDFIVLHCTATPQDAKITSILNYWKNTLKWKNVGYHYIIEMDGKITQLAEESQVTNGVAGFNSNSIHISYIGGINLKGKPLDTRTPDQKYAMEVLVHKLKKKYPTAIVQGHRDFPKVAKACPSFDVKEWLKTINL